MMAASQPHSPTLAPVAPPATRISSVDLPDSMPAFLRASLILTAASAHVFRSYLQSPNPGAFKAYTVLSASGRSTFKRAQKAGAQ